MGVAQFDEQLDQIGLSEEAGFNATLYARKQQDFSELAQHAMDKAKECLATENVTIAEERLNESESALWNMTKVSLELDTMERTFHDKLKTALAAKVDPKLRVANKFSRDASSLQHQAHKVMDPLYSWGDAAEDKADKFNDQTNDALSNVDKVLRSFRRHLTHHSWVVQKDAETKLFIDEDRVATWRKVHKLVRNATGHVALQQQAAHASLLSVQLGSFEGLTLLMTTAVAASIVGASIAAAYVKSRNIRSNEYQLLSA